MDVRCEKCQTEYELDEARLKPGGVTVKCTNCGHMFKIRKRTITNVGTGPAARDPNGTARPRTGSSKQPLSGRAPAALDKARSEPALDEETRQIVSDDAPTTVERHWLIRLENGEQKSCRELATLQQWIISSVVTRESLISRTGKTWKRLGDIPDLGQYFTIADEARATRDRAKPASRPTPIKEVPGTLTGYSAAAIPGLSAAPQAAGGTILPDDDDEVAERRTTRSVQSRPVAHTPPPPVPPRGAARTPPMGSNAVASTATGPAPAGAPQAPQVPGRRPRTTPPPPPPKRQAGREPTPPPPLPPPAPPAGNRATAMWATDGVAPEASGLPASGPYVGNLAAIPDEPAFAGRVRMSPGDEASFETTKVRMPGGSDERDEDDAILPARRGSRAGMLVLVMALLVMSAAAAAVYVFVIRKAKDDQAALQVNDAGGTAGTATGSLGTPGAPDAAAIVEPVIDAAAPIEASALDGARRELAADVEPRLRTAAQSLEGKADAPSQALRAHLLAQLTQDLRDRASLTADKTVADQLRKDADKLALEALGAAQRALRDAGDDAGANLAMAEVLRLQGKPVRDSKRHLDIARAKADKDWTRDIALADALLLVRDGKLDDARAAFTAIDDGDGKLEASGDVRARLHLALVLAAQNKAADAKPLVEAVLAAQPEHAGAKALADKLETLVAKTDPLPPEDGKDAGTSKPPGAGNAPGAGKANPVGPGPEAGGGESYDRLLARADQLADSNCGKAIELYAKALEQKPNGVEALTGMGYCHIDAKQFSSAFSKFRAALAVSPRYEPALRGVAEAYQQQGRKDLAIEAYKAYLEIYPNSAAAKRQLERLGGDSTSPPPGGGAGSAAPSAPASAPPAPAPPPTPAAPAPASAPPPSGAGSSAG